jgi:hypothetical protein
MWYECHNCYDIVIIQTWNLCKKFVISYIHIFTIQLLWDKYTSICGLCTLLFVFPRVIWQRRKFIQPCGGCIVTDCFLATQHFMDMLAQKWQLKNWGKNAISTWRQVAITIFTLIERTWKPLFWFIGITARIMYVERIHLNYFMGMENDVLVKHRIQTSRSLSAS